MEERGIQKEKEMEQRGEKRKGRILHVCVCLHIAVLTMVQPTEM